MREGQARLQRLRRYGGRVGGVFAEAYWFVPILDSRFREVGSEVTSSQPSCFATYRRGRNNIGEMFRG